MDHEGILDQPLPISLHVNYESRSGTLNYYQIFYRSDAPGFDPSKHAFDRPIFISVELDTLVLSHAPISFDYVFLGCAPWILEKEEEFVNG